MTDPIRAALERLIARLDETTDPNGPVPAWSDSYLAARATLSQPEPPAEGEVGELVEWLSDQVAVYEMAFQSASGATRLRRIAALLQQGQSALHRLHRLQRENARFREPERTILCDLLANGTLLPDPDGKRYGVQPEPGEVGELVALIRQIALAWEPDACLLGNMTAKQLARAADLLEQRHPAPVPVSERPILKSSPFNDSQGRCWCGTGELIDRTGDMPIEYPASWELREPSHGDDCLLPCNALPLPAKEVGVHQQTNRGSESSLSEFADGEMPLG